MSGGDWVKVIAAGVTILLLAAAGVSDVSRYRIPNTIVYAIAAAFAVGAIVDPSWPAIGWSALAAVGMFLLGAGLFALGLFGGGDVKLIAAMALWTGVEDLPRFLVIMSAAGGVLGFIWLMRRRRQPAAVTDAPNIGDDASPTTADGDAPKKISNKLPYGVAIALAGFDFFLTSTHSPLAQLLPWIS